LSQEDKNDLFDLSKALCNATTDEELQAAAAGLREILDQSETTVRRIEISEDFHEGDNKWIEFVAQRIKDARTEAGMTQDEVTQLTGLPQSHISRLENRQHSPSRATLEKIAAATKKPLSFFDPIAE
jgi:DNA-binding XRE family transcriptional regulator